MLLNEIVQTRSDTSVTQPQFTKPDFRELYQEAQKIDRFRGMPENDFVNMCRIGKAVYFSKLKDVVPLPTREDVMPQQSGQTVAPATPMPCIVVINNQYAFLSGGDVVARCIQTHVDPVCWLVRA